MSEIRNYPNGYEITICKRRDILDCLDKNIIDKQVVSSVIEELEDDLLNYVLNDIPASIPTLGSIKYIEEKKIKNSEEIRSLLKEGRDLLSKDEYIMLKSKLNKDVYSKVSGDRYYKYITSKYIKDNSEFYKFLLKTHTEIEARIICYTFRIYTLDDQYKTYHGTE